MLLQIKVNFLSEEKNTMSPVKSAESSAAELGLLNPFKKMLAVNTADTLHLLKGKLHTSPLFYVIG